MNKFEAKDIEIGGKVYAVTKDGGIFMHSYVDRAGKIRKNKWLKTIPNKGRMQVHFSTINGDSFKKYVYQIVMLAWGTPAPEGMEMPTIDHIDNNPLNDHIDNLQWMSHSDNVKKMWDNKTEEELAEWSKSRSEVYKKLNLEGRAGRQINKN